MWLVALKKFMRFDFRCSIGSGGFRYLYEPEGPVPFMFELDGGNYCFMLLSFVLKD